MKKLLSLSPASVLVACGLGLAMTLGGFWHHQDNQTHINRMTVLNQGASTCFNRLSQTFTAVMIKDLKSPYLDKGFMALSDECLSEAIKGINPFRQSVGKGYETLNKLVSEVHWFHESVLKIHAPLLAGQNVETEKMNQLAERFSKMESFKVALVDEIDAANARYTEIQSNDQVLMGAGLLLFVIGLSILSLQEFNRYQLRKEIERSALNLLKAGQANVGAMVDQLVERALATQGMPVTGQIFKDYHGEILERLSSKFSRPEVKEEVRVREEAYETPAEEEVAGPKTSLKEVLVSLQKVHTKDLVNIAEVRDVQLSAPFEATEQLINSALNKLIEKNIENKKILISNQVHSDRSVMTFFLAGATFSASELECANGTLSADTTDMNLMILKEMAAEVGASCHVENKADRQGKITGMSIRLTMKRAPKERSKLVSVVKGKKKDLTRELMN